MHAAARILALLIIAGSWAGWEALDRMTPAVASQEARSEAIAPTTDAEAVIFAAADQYGVPRNLARAVLTQESGGDAGSTSSAGAAGLMQVMPGTAAGIAADLGIASYDIYDPQTNATFGMYYLSEKIKRYGVDWGLAAYNWGPAGVDGFLSRHPAMAGQGWNAVLACCAGEIPSETQAYVRNILAMAQREEAGGAPIRAQLVAYALSLQGIPYVRGGRSATGGDCSGTMQHVYLQVTGLDIGGTTFSQWPNLTPIEETQLQPGDLWFGQYANDQHVGMVADVDGDGRWDLINNGGLANDMHVDSDFLSMDYFNQHTMGFRRVL